MLNKERSIEMDNNYIYRDCGNEEENQKMHLIEKALGFKLFFWQKTYITRGCFRQTGRTTAIIIRILTQGTKPVDLSNDRAVKEYLTIDCPKYSTGLSGEVFKREVKKIHEKLVRAGIKTNPVFYTKEDKENFFGRMNTGKSKVTCSRCGMEVEEEGSYKVITVRAERSRLTLSPLLDIAYNKIGEAILCSKCQKLISETEMTMTQEERR